MLIKITLITRFLVRCTYMAIIILAISVSLTAAEDSLPPLPEGSFSVVVLPDTQDYIVKNTEIFTATTQWIVDNIEKQHIIFVTHVGDVIQRNIRSEWDVVRQCMDILHGRVAYAFSVGDHDMGLTKPKQSFTQRILRQTWRKFKRFWFSGEKGAMKRSKSDSSLFQEYFSQSRFSDFAWYGGGMKNNVNSFQIISAEGIYFVFIHLECNSPDEVLEWANGVFEKYPNHKAIVTTHMYLGPIEKPKTLQSFLDPTKGRMLWKKRHGVKGNTPEQMWQKCFSKHKNLFLILCGDQSRTQTMQQTSIGIHGNIVHELLSDYRDGYIRIIRFIPANEHIQVMTYSPYHQKYCEGTEIVSDRKEHQFMLPFRH
jgi:hypothetical protein